MGLMHGKYAKIYWDASDTDTNLTLGQSWDLDVTHDVGEITSMQDTWKTYMTGFQAWTATVVCLLDTAGAKIGFGGDDGMGDDEACYLELYFHWDSGTPKYRALYGTAICTGVSPAQEKDGIATVTYTFQGNAQCQWHSSAAAEPTY